MNPQPTAGFCLAPSLRGTEVKALSMRLSVLVVFHQSRDVKWVLSRTVKLDHFCDPPTPVTTEACAFPSIALSLLLQAKAGNPVHPGLELPTTTTVCPGPLR